MVSPSRVQVLARDGVRVAVGGDSELAKFPFGNLGEISMGKLLKSTILPITYGIFHGDYFRKSWLEGTSVHFPKVNQLLSWLRCWCMGKSAWENP